MHDPNLHLFVDDREIHQIINLQRILNKPARLPEPVLIADAPWESGCRVAAWGSVIREPDGLFRLWYFLLGDQSAYSYAESRDGIHWEKPILGLVEWRGRKENNVFYRFPTGTPVGVINGMDGLTVVRDDEEPDPAQRYKLIANMQDSRMWARFHPEQQDRHYTDEEIARARSAWGHYLLTSPDGIHWTREPQFVKPAWSDYMMVVRDYRNRRWWLNERPRSYSDPTSGHRGRRGAGLATSIDLKNWSFTEAVFLHGPESDFGRLWEWHGMTPFNYGNQDLGFLEVQMSVYLDEGFELVSHRDGEPWQRVAPGHRFLERGPEGSYDRSLMAPLHNPPIPVGDKLYIYYNPVGPPREDGVGSRVIGLATIGLDRFAALSHGHEKTGEPTGIVVTRPVVVAADVLQVNLETYRGDVKVGLKYPDWSDVPGYGLADCVPVAANGVRLPVRWRERADLSELRGREVVMIFNVRSAQLYSYRFAPAS